MNTVTAILGFFAVLFLTTAVFLFRALKQAKAELKELLRENETHETNARQQAENDDIYFKTDRDFNISFISESAARTLGYDAQELIGRHLLGSLFENNEASQEFLLGTFNRISKKQSTLNSQLLLKRQDGKNILMLARVRPLLNEILKCDGLSFLCKDISNADRLKNKLTDLQSVDPVTGILNEQSFLRQFEHDFNLATRYNKEMSAIAVELKDIYEFIAKGIDFETADTMLKNISNLCLKIVNEKGYAGRVDKTKIILALKGSPRDEARQQAATLFDDAVHSIRDLRIDASNAQMIVISYSNRKGFSDSFDAMTSRLQRHINMALRNKEYGVISSDKRPDGFSDLENIKG